MLAVACEREMLATGIALTAIAAVAVFSSTAAVIVVAPGVIPLTNPAPFTDATAVLVLLQLTVRPVMG